jgi:hypothetical protein
MDYFAATTLSIDGRMIDVAQKVPSGLLSEDEAARLLKAGAITTLEAEQAKIDARSPKVETVTDWGFDPASIADDTLEILNMKILERAKALKQEVPPFEDAEEARMFMSAEWKAE